VKHAALHIARVCLGIVTVVAGWLVLVGLLHVGWGSHLLA
jgi:hypothetical protein